MDRVAAGLIVKEVGRWSWLGNRTIVLSTIYGKALVKRGCHISCAFTSLACGALPRVS